MKRIFCYVALLLPLLLLCGCPHDCWKMSPVHENCSIESEHYIAQYWYPFNIRWSNSKQSHNPGCIDLSFRPPSDAMSYDESVNVLSVGEELDVFMELASRHGDTVPNYSEVKNYVKSANYYQVLAYDFKESACAYEIDSIRVFSLDDWDDEHPAGSSLNDLIRFDAYSPKDYIRSGFSDTVPKLKHINKLLSETVKEDFDLVTFRDWDDKHRAGHMRFELVSKPTQSLDCQRLYIIFMLENGRQMGCRTEYRLTFSE